MATAETGGLLTEDGITLTTLFINILLPPQGFPIPFHKILGLLLIMDSAEFNFLIKEIK